MRRYPQSTFFLFLLFALLAAVPLALDAQPVLEPNDFTNRRLGLPGDASSAGWNPSVLGMDEQLDAVLGGQYDTAFTFSNLSYGLFAKAWYLGAGTIGSTDSNSVQRYYTGIGFPLDIGDAIPFWVGAGVALRAGDVLFDDAAFSLGATAALADNFHAGATLYDLLGNQGSLRAALDLNWRATGWLGLRGALLLNPADTLGRVSALTPELGLDLWLFDRVLALSTTFDINREDLRIGVEMLFGRDIVGGSFNELDMETGNIGYRQGVGVIRYRPSGNSEEYDADDDYDDPFAPTSTQQGWAPERSYSPVGLSYTYSVSDATEDPEALQRPCEVASSEFDSPAGLFRLLSYSGDAYQVLADALARISPSPDDLYRSINRSFYSRRVRGSELMSSDSTSIVSKQGYSIGIQSVDNANFPLVSVYMQVADNEGRSVRGLTTADFAFADPSMEIVSVRPIDSTHHQPVDVTMIIDCSGSMSGEIDAVRANARNFVDRMEASGADYRIGGVLYGSIIYDTLHPSDDFGKFRGFLQNAAAIGGDEITTLAIKAATEMNYRPEAQRIFVLITDDWGVQQNAALTEADLVSMLWDTRARLYTISSINPVSCKNNLAVTTRLTLGNEYDITAPFNSILDEIGTDITTLYELVYRSKMKEAPKVTILRGKVRDETGQPVGTTINLAEALDDNAVLRVRTNGTTGEYEVEIVEGRVYGADISGDPYLPLSETVDLTGVRKGDTAVRDFTLLLPPTTLRGQILDQDDKGVPGRVRIDDATTLETVMTIETDRNGRYQTVINEGRVYRLTPVVPEYLPTPVELDTRAVKKGSELVQDLRVISIDAAIATGATFRLNNIFFDFDKSELKPESIPELKKLVDLLNQYALIRVEIGAHTDARGSDDYNVKLSGRRAQSVVDWLIDNGIDPTRLVSKGYGETTPVASNETDEGRALNRRVEFKLVR